MVIIYIIIIPYEILIETLKNLPEQPVTFSIDDQNYNIEIIYKVC